MNNSIRIVVSLFFICLCAAPPAQAQRENQRKPFAAWQDISGTARNLLKYDSVGSLSEGLADAYLDGKHGFIDEMGREVTTFKYDLVGSFSDGLALAYLNDKFGFIDKTGREVVPVKYDEIWCDAFRKEGFVGVVLNGKKGFADVDGNEYFDF